MEERFIGPNEKPGRGQNLKSNLEKHLRIGRITSVDYEKGLLTLVWEDSFGERSNVKLTNAMSTGRGFLGGMPEIGSFVLCGFTKQTPTSSEPVILQYLNLNYESSKKYVLSRGKAEDELQNISSKGQLVDTRQKIGYGIERIKQRKLYPGEIQAESTQGSELYLDDNVYLSNSALNEIEIKSADQSIRFSSRQQYHQTNASRIWNGMITREPIKGDQLLQPTVLSNGQKIQIITDSNNPYHLGGKALNEYRLELYENTTGKLNVSEVNSGMDVSDLDPMIEFTLGTTVGNDKSDVQRYSKVLRPQIFGDANASNASLDFIECLPEEYSSLAGTFLLKCKSSATVAFDKQGHLFTNIPASTAQHPLGAGRSWEGNFSGSIKWVVGANTNTGNSIILTTKGAVKENIGFDLNNFSKQTVAQKAVTYKILGPNSNGEAFVVETIGSVKYNVTGNYVNNIKGDYYITTTGKIEEQVMGTKNENYIGDKNSVYGGNQKEAVIKDTESIIGGKRVTKITGKTDPVSTAADPTDTLEVTLGSRHETYTSGNLVRKLLLGDMTSDLTLGSSIEKLVAGNKEIKITAGDYTLEITAGNIAVKTLSGTVDIDSTTNSVTVNGLLEVRIKSGVKVVNDALKVELGSLPLKGGVVTGSPSPSHFDYITGAPLVGSTSVTATI